MGWYYITNGDCFLGNLNEASATMGSLACQAKRFNHECATAALSTLEAVCPGEYSIQKFYESSNLKNYVITNATRFIGNDDSIVDDVTRARAFKTAADADSYMDAHEMLISSMGREPSVVNENYEAVDMYGRRKTRRNTLKMVNLKVKKKVRKSNRVHIHKNTRLAVYKRDNGVCQMCGNPLTEEEFTLDHIVPLDRGGKNEMSNYRCLCDKCNKIKGNSFDEELLKKLDDINCNFVFKNPDSDMTKRLVRMMVRGMLAK